MHKSNDNQYPHSVLMNKYCVDLIKNNLYKLWKKNIIGKKVNLIVSHLCNSMLADDSLIIIFFRFKTNKKRPFDDHFTNGEIKLMVTPINLLLV